MESGIKTEEIGIKVDPITIGVRDRLIEVGVVFEEEANIMGQGIRMVKIGAGRKARGKDQKERIGHKLRHSE